MVELRSAICCDIFANSIVLFMITKWSSSSRFFILSNMFCNKRDVAFFISAKNKTLPNQQNATQFTSKHLKRLTSNPSNLRVAESLQNTVFVTHSILLKFKVIFPPINNNFCPPPENSTKWNSGYQPDLSQWNFPCEQNFSP